MTTVTIEREGYKVQGEVRYASGSPYGLRPTPEVGEVEQWIHDPAGFKEAHGMEPTEESLAIVVKREEDAIIDDLIDALGEG